MKKLFQTATLSHDELRSKLWRELDEEYPGGQSPEGDYSQWCVLGDVYDGFCIAKASVNGKYGLYKFPYTIGENDDVELGEPVDLLTAGKATAAEIAQSQGHMEFRASKIVTGADAKELIDDLSENNPLFAAIKDSPNTHLVVFDLTSVGRPSKHAGKVKYQLAVAGLPAALPTLISKPIHVTPDLDAHQEAGKAPVAIGTFLGAVGLDNADGTKTVRAVGTLWSSDYPDIVEEIKAKRAQLGASYEIAYLAATASRLGANVIEIKDYEFSGGAILKKTAAAHPETQLLMASKDEDTVFDVFDEEGLPRLLAYFREATSFTRADKLSYEQRTNLKDSDFALVQDQDGKKIRRFPIQDEAHRKNAWARLPQAKNLSDAERAEVANKIISRAKSAGDDWAKPYKKSNGKWVKSDTKEGGAMPKFKGIPDELESIVEALLAEATVAAVKAAKEPIEAELATIKAQMDEMHKKDKMSMDEKAKAEREELVAKAAGLESKVAELTVKLEAATKDLTEKTEALAQIETAKALQATKDKLKAEFGLTDEQLAEKEREPLVLKAAAKEAMTVEEWRALTAGAKGTQPGDRRPQPRVVPLMAGMEPIASDKPDVEALKRSFPAATQVRFR